jgi:hypothetical protein
LEPHRGYWHGSQSDEMAGSQALNLDKSVYVYLDRIVHLYLDRNVYQNYLHVNYHQVELFAPLSLASRFTKERGSALRLSMLVHRVFSLPSIRGAATARARKRSLS